MLFCPSCSKPLSRKLTSSGPVYACRCGGRAATFKMLERVGREDVVRRVRLQAIGSARPGARPCPLCDGKMTLVDFPLGGARRVALEACGRCRIVWFDAHEYQAVKASAPPKGPQDASADVAPTGAKSVWQILPALFGLPIELGQDRLRDRPVVTRGLVAVMTIVMAMIMAGGAGMLRRVVEDWGMIPGEWARHGGLTLLTSFFLHAGWWHLISNMYFLWVFGDNVEDHLGHLKYMGLLAASHATGLWMHATFGGSPHVPCVGASAGISGVLAYYAIVFPKARIGIFGWAFTLFRVLRIPAIAGLLLYVVIQALGAYTASATGGVAYLAHLGGLAAGAVIAIFAVALSNDTAR